VTYLEFHLVFILPALILTALAAWRRGAVTARDRVWLGVMVVLAVVYTTPWDNYLVAAGIWDYGPDRVIGTIGWVPIEEYLFFALQPLLTGMWYFAIRGSVVDSTPPSSAGRVGLLLALALIVAGAGALATEHGRYLGLIVVWAVPIILLQWGVGASYLWAQRRDVLLGIGVPTVYLWICDRLAIGLGIWEISPQYTTGWHLFGLPIEEAVFFLITNLMVVQGLALVRVPFAVLRTAGRRPSGALSTTMPGSS
jgi:lycopene cyclase domain-containing protein